MAKQAFIVKKFRKDRLALVEILNGVIDQYMAQGFVLTVRQLFYQCIGDNLLPDSWIDPFLHTKNTARNYDRIVELVNDARLAGYIDWNGIEDRGRNLIGYSAWSSPAEIIRSAWSSFQMNLWASQPHYCEVWCEKQALEAIVGRACDPWRVPYLSCKGYLSQSEMKSAAERMAEQVRLGKRVTVFHLGDHDPSGIDMSRDNRDRLAMFLEGVGISDVDRLALNIEQVRLYNPPPNFAKQTDSRYNDYIERFGDEDCWELDALRPKVLVDTIDEAIQGVVDHKAWAKAVANEANHKEVLRQAYTHWPAVATFLNGKVKVKAEKVKWECPDCYSEQEAEETDTEATCDFCGTRVTLEDTDDEGQRDAFFAAGGDGEEEED